MSVILKALQSSKDEPENTETPSEETGTDDGVYFHSKDVFVKKTLPSNGSPKARFSIIALLLSGGLILVLSYLGTYYFLQILCTTFCQNLLSGYTKHTKYAKG
ncbi:hypothetical protein KJ708_08835, partial [bacterium]|nr:hypothetical protein [bacterium]